MAAPTIVEPAPSGCAWPWPLVGVGEHELAPGLAHVPLHVAGEHTLEDVCMHAIGLPVVSAPMRTPAHPSGSPEQPLESCEQQNVNSLLVAPTATFGYLARVRDERTERKFLLHAGTFHDALESARRRRYHHFFRRLDGRAVAEGNSEVQSDEYCRCQDGP